MLNINNFFCFTAPLQTAIGYIKIKTIKETFEGIGLLGAKAIIILKCIFIEIR